MTWVLVALAAAWRARVRRALGTDVPTYSEGAGVPGPPPRVP